MSAVGEAASEEARDWCLELLGEQRPQVLVAAVLGLENMAHTSPDRDFLGAVLDPAIARLNEAEDGSEASIWLSHLIRLVPQRLRRRARVPLRSPLSPEPGRSTGARSRANADWLDCEARARRITAALGVPDQPMLARLLYDVAFSDFEVRAVTAYMILGAVPGLAGPATAELAGIVDAHRDPVPRDRAARRLSGARLGELPDQARRWLAQEDPTRIQAALRLYGGAGQAPPPEDLRRAAARDDLERAALFAAGLAGAPSLRTWARERTSSLGGGARWWIAEGTLVRR